LGIWYLYDVVVIAACDFRYCDGRRHVDCDVAGDEAGPTPVDR